MAPTVTGYELVDACVNLATEIKAWNAATLVNGGAANAFGTSGDRIYDTPQEVSRVGRDQPVVFVAHKGREGNIYDKTSEGTGGLFEYDAYHACLVVILARGSWVYKHKELRQWSSSLQKWLEQKGANGYFQEFAVGKVEPYPDEGSRIEEGGAMSWNIPIIGKREVTRIVSF